MGRQVRGQNIGGGLKQVVVVNQISNRFRAATKKYDVTKVEIFQQLRGDTSVGRDIGDGLKRAVCVKCVSSCRRAVVPLCVYVQS